MFSYIYIQLLIYVKNYSHLEMKSLKHKVNYFLENKISKVKTQLISFKF